MYANAGNVLDHPRAELDQALAYRCEFSVRQWVRLRDGGAHLGLARCILEVCSAGLWSLN
jgi:hypothetical protein